VPASYHAPIIQQAVLLKTGASDPAATAFMKFLKGSQARAIIKRYGYEVR
jgi:molybdate transport system substrate-binding protein